jgi:hypothetical protein
VDQGGRFTSLGPVAKCAEVAGVVRRRGAAKFVDGLNSAKGRVINPFGDAVNLIDVAMSPFDEADWGIGRNAPGEGAHVPPAPQRARPAATS